MILTCPECATRYLLPEGDEIGPSGRTVRCAKCQTSWYVSSDLDELFLKDNQAAEIAETQAVQAIAEQRERERAVLEAKMMAREEETREVRPTGRASEPTLSAAFSGPGAHVEMRDRVDRRRRNIRLSIIGLIWGITLGALALAALFAYSMRQDVIERYPQAATIYKAFGIEVSAEGLVFDKSVTRSVFIDGNPVLVVNGNVKNITTRTVELPMVVLSLHNSAKETLAEWRVEFAEPDLGKGKRAEFVAQFPNPPIDAVNLRIAFDDGSGQGVIIPSNSADGGILGENSAQSQSVPIPQPAVSPEEAEIQREIEPIPMIVDQ